HSPAAAGRRQVSSKKSKLSALYRAGSTVVPPRKENKPEEKTTQRNNHENTQNESQSFRITSPYCDRGLACRRIRGLCITGAPVELQWQLYTGSPHSGGKWHPMAGADHDRRRRHGAADNADGSALVWFDTRSAQWDHLRPQYGRRRSEQLFGRGL